MRKEPIELAAGGTNNSNSQIIPKKIKSSKTLNILRVLDYIRGHSAVTTAELSQNAEIPIASTYRLIQSMMDSGLITCIDKQGSSVGRRAGLYSVDPNYKHMMGIYMGKRHLNVFIINMFGDILNISRERYPENCTLKNVTDMLDNGIAKVVKGCYGNKKRISKISLAGVVAEAAVDANAGEIIEFADLSCVNGFNIREHIAKKYGLETYIMKYVQLAACIYMKDMAANDIHDYIYLSLGFGVGAGVVLNGALYEGAQNNAGELGTLLKNMESYLPVDLYRDMERYLEREENEELSEWIKSHEPDMTSSNALMKAVDLAVVRGDDYIAGLLNKAAKSIAKLCSIFAEFFDPQMIIVGGDVNKTTRKVWENILEEVNHYPNIRCSVVPSHLDKSRFEMTSMRLVDYAYENIYAELIEKQ